MVKLKKILKKIIIFLGFVFFKLKNLFGYNIKSKNYPLYLKINLTGRCNLNCYMCKAHRDNIENKNFYDMSDEVFEKIKPFIKKAKYITFSGSGEPTISLNFLERLDWIRANSSARIKLFTNGISFLNKSFLNKVGSCVDEIHLSINGLKFYEKIMVGAKYDNLQRILSNLSDFKKQKNIRIVLGFILMKNTIDDIIPAGKLIKKYGFDLIQFKDLWVYDENMKSNSYRHNFELEKIIKNKLVELKKMDIKFESPFKIFGNKLNKFDISKRLVSFRQYNFFFWIFFFLKIKCNFPWIMLKISYKGKVSICCNGNTPLANIYDQNLFDIWNSNEILKYRKGLLTKKYYGACKNCRYINDFSKNSFERD